MSSNDSGFFTVARRSDGYVFASKRDYPLTAAQLNHSAGTVNGAPATFDVLLVTTEWPEARDRIESERARTDLGPDPRRKWTPR